MALLLRGMGGNANKLLVVGFGNQIPLALIDAALLGDTDADAAWNSRRRKPWEQELWWSDTQTYTIRAGMVGVNKKEIYIPTYKTISKTVYDDPLIGPKIHAEYKWSKRFKAGLSNILINALRVIRNDKGSGRE